MDITAHERLIGFDIRYDVMPDPAIAKKLLQYQTITKCCSLDKNIWPSRFRDASLAEHKLAVQEQRANTAQPTIVDGICVLPWFYFPSYYYTVSKLWDNLTDMLTLYSTVQPNDHIIAISCCIVEKPEIYCHKRTMKFNIFTNFNNGSLDLILNVETSPATVPKDVWRLLGYDVGETFGYSFLHYEDEAIINKPTLKEELIRDEGYPLGDNRNSYGLLDDLETAVYESILLNKYRDDCPDFAYGIYELTDMATLKACLAGHTKG